MYISSKSESGKVAPTRLVLYRTEDLKSENGIEAESKLAFFKDVLLRLAPDRLVF